MGFITLVLSHIEEGRGFEELKLIRLRLIGSRRWPTYTALLVAGVCLCVYSPRRTITPIQSEQNCCGVPVSSEYDQTNYAEPCAPWDLRV